MPKRSNTPGLVRRARDGKPRLYWSAESLSKRAAGYPDRWIALPSDASAAELEDLCQTYAARLEAWLDRGRAPRYIYDGTIGSLCDAFERHPQSPIHEVKRNTAESYLDSLKVIRSTIAPRAVRAVAPIDAKFWYEVWRAPATRSPADIARLGPAPERIKRAHDAIAALRMILRFGRALGHAECGDLAEGLASLQFARSARRETEMTVAHCRAFIEAALGLPNARRGLYMAIGVAAQFETMLRQGDIVGEWVSDGRNESWRGAFTWENIPGGILRLKTSKTKTPGVYDLAAMELLWPLMQRVPQRDRVGAIVKGEAGEPIRVRSYRKWYRQIARLAGIPDDIWNMDARAGGVTEALEAGVDIATVGRAATHANPVMTARYDRANEIAVATVAEARRKARAK